MTPTIDELLAEAAAPVGGADFDAAAGLRRLAEEAARGPRRAAGLARTRQARRRLLAVCHGALNRPDVPAHVNRLVGEPVDIEGLDVEGALMYACLLFLTDHPESAQYWWQLAAGAGDRSAAYCLHLHHRCRGELREEEHWADEYVRLPQNPAGRIRFALLAVFGLRDATVPTEPLEPDLERLAEASGNACGIVSRPDRRLTARLTAVVTRR